MEQENVQSFRHDHLFSLKKKNKKINPPTVLDLDPW